MPYQPSTVSARMGNIGASAVLSSVSPVLPSRPASGTPAARAISTTAGSDAPARWSEVRVRTARLDRGERIERRRGDARIVVVERATAAPPRPTRTAVPRASAPSTRGSRRRSARPSRRRGCRRRGAASVSRAVPAAPARALIAGERVDRRPTAAQHAARDRDALEIGTQRVDRRDGEALHAGERGVRRLGEGARREIAAADLDVLAATRGPARRMAPSP